MPQRGYSNPTSGAAKRSRQGRKPAAGKISAQRADVNRRVREKTEAARTARTTSTTTRPPRNQQPLVVLADVAASSRRRRAR